MPDSDTTTGATPGAGATPATAGPDENNSPAGATPEATKPPEPPATGDEALGEAGKQILRDARRSAKEADDRAKAAESELQQLREAGQSDQEKTLNQARREAKAEERAFWQSRIREAEVRGALRGAGIANDKFLSLALAASEFRDLKVEENGTVPGIAEAVEAFRKDLPQAFGAPAQPAPGGSWGGAEGGSNTKHATSLDEAVADHYLKPRTMSR